MPCPHFIAKTVPVSMVFNVRCVSKLDNTEKGPYKDKL